MLDICLLGSGGMMPLPNRWLTSLLVKYNGKMLLIDCGEGTQIPLKMAEWGFKTIDVICLTHYHCDHVAGLPGLLLTLGNCGREEPVKLMGPPGLEEVIHGIRAIAPVLPFELELIEIHDDRMEEMNFMGLILKSLPLEHTISCLSYSIELKRVGKFDTEKAINMKIPVTYWNHLQKGESITIDGKTFRPDMVLGEARKGIKVTYCTDTRPIPDLINFITESDIFICEGMYGDEGKLHKAAEKKHMTFSEAALLAEQGHVKELWLTHYSPSLTEPEEYIDSARKIFKNTLAGKDLLTRAITFLD